jgi:hypothetical protein
MVSVVPLVRRPNRLALPIAMDTVFHLGQMALDASVDPDAVRLAFDLPALCREAGRDFLRLASADAQASQTAHLPRERLKLQPAEPRTVAHASPVLALEPDAVQEFPMVVAPELP